MRMVSIRTKINKEIKMFRKLMLVLLAGTICLLAVTSVLAQKNPEVYNASDYEQLTGKKMEFQEAPMLRTMVAAGELPPLEKRLPEDPLVVKPAEEIGQYGGTLRRLNERGSSNFRMNFGFEFLIAYSPDMAKIYPNVLKGWKVSENAKKFTLYLRKGMRWSDGVPFTADDLMFYFEDVALNKDLSPVPPSRLVIGGEPGVVKKIDDYTIEASFPASYGVFIENFARWRDDPYLPKHYLTQFHPDYTPMSEIEKVMKEEGFDSWVSLFEAKRGGKEWFATPERPVIGPWVAQNLPSEPIQIMTRNPYYWKVDTEGNQLPYIDKITRLLVMDPEAMLLKTLAGEIDIQSPAYFGAVENYSLIMENREKGNYRVVRTFGFPGNLGTIFFNYSHEDLVLKKFFNDKKFRIALSVAINREEINEFLFKGQAVSSHPTSASGPPFYGERLFKDYIQYDPKLANKLLDEIGLASRDKEGYRLRPDGERLRMVNTVRTLKAVTMEMAELYKDYWKEIGIEIVNKPQPYQVLKTLFPSGKYDMITSGMSLGGRPLNPLYRMGSDGLYGRTAPQWSLWVQSEGEKGEEPPQEVKRMIEIREEALGSASEEKRIALTLEIFKILQERLWVIGGLNAPVIGAFITVSNRIGNMPSEVNAEWLYTIPAQYFIKE
jgi:peptide/nickel transport system substrate-binding protein